ncbi:MAG: hypothetical protein A2275_11650 [Bacteroidetes bacterium RIFOXYA12_FULL_35_11]|nr:MAG: hypothetical protein A2X01_09470 [Bacteroidetes bacterium GWF2_35_48]OFY72643.1 MAG: hypothetical protein A2275_11650 [Bacteroidetes bacterium RIFOXYA12_FULL_35_11]HBX50150.1 hypothetical protein [Bacteroidales bacterium]
MRYIAFLILFFMVCSVLSQKQKDVALNVYSNKDIKEPKLIGISIEQKAIPDVYFDPAFPKISLKIRL